MGDLFSSPKQSTAPVVQKTDTPIPATDDAIGRAAARDEALRRQRATNVGDDNLSREGGTAISAARRRAAAGGDSYSKSTTGSA